MSTLQILDLDAVVAAANSLDPLPISITELVQLFHADDFTVSDVVAIVERDPALTGAVLRSANSVASGPREPVGAVRDGVVRIGSLTVLALGFARSMQSLVHRALPAYGLAEGELWRHCVATSVAADALRRVLPERRAFASATTAALLHDVGKVVLARSIQAEAILMIEDQVASGRSRHDVEHEVLAVHHGEVGGFVARAWRLPQEIVSGITHHHFPERDESGLADLLHVADVVGHDLVTRLAIREAEEARRLEAEAAAEAERLAAEAEAAEQNWDGEPGDQLEVVDDRDEIEILGASPAEAELAAEDRSFEESAPPELVVEPTPVAMVVSGDSLARLGLSIADLDVSCELALERYADIAGRLH